MNRVNIPKYVSTPDYTRILSMSSMLRIWEDKDTDDRLAWMAEERTAGGVYRGASTEWGQDGAMLGNGASPRMGRCDRGDAYENRRHGQGRCRTGGLWLGES